MNYEYKTHQLIHLLVHQKINLSSDHFYPQLNKGKGEQKDCSSYSNQQDLKIPKLSANRKLRGGVPPIQLERQGNEQHLLEDIIIQIKT